MQTEAVEENVTEQAPENVETDAGEKEAAERPEPEAETATESEPAEAEPEDEVTISIGEEPPPPKDEPAPAWVKELRKSHRELQRKNRELEAQLVSTRQQTAPPPVVIGKKPTLEDCDYDAEKFEKTLAEWFDRKRKADEAQAKAQEQVENQNKAWRSRLENYAKNKNSLKVSDFDDAEAVVTENLSVIQQGVLIKGAENPHYVIYALGKNPKKAKELAAISDPIEFAFAVAKLEAQLKVSSRKPASAPEKAISGTGRVAGAIDSTLEKLRAEAEKTGNYSKVIAYKNSKRK